MVTKVYFVDPKGSAIVSQGIRESISVMSTNFKFYILLKIIAKLLQLAICLILMTRFVFQKLSVPKKRATLILIKVKSCNVSLRMLLVCTCKYLQSLLGYKFLILDIYIRGRVA